MWIDEHYGEWPVDMMCRVLKVSRSGFYAWRQRPESEQAKSRRRLIEIIKEIHEESKRSYGSPRVHRELVARGEICCENTVARYMRKNDIVAKTKRKFKQTTDSNHGLPVAKNLLDRDFDQLEPNRVWVSDITYIPTREGWLYLATVLDLFGRKIVGWSMSHRIDRHLVMDALTMAVKNRRPPPNLIHHSDRGSQYASDDFQKLLDEYGMICSMSRKGNCWDNAVAESFFRSLKTELVHHEDFATRDEARLAIFEYIEVFYNRIRRHSSLGYLSPADYEALMQSV
jgi:transposase InsO family protein